MCPRPVAHTAWPYSELSGHWDCFGLYYQQTVAGHAIPVQRSALAELVELECVVALVEPPPPRHNVEAERHVVSRNCGVDIHHLAMQFCLTAPTMSVRLPSIWT